MSEGRYILLLAAFVVSGGCSSILRNERAHEILRQDEFDKQIQVAELPPEPGLMTSGLYVQWPGPPPVPSAMEPAVAPKKSGRGRQKEKIVIASVASAPEGPLQAPAEHEPPHEDGEGFVGRRPKIDPFRVGEKVSLEMSYFGVSAGEMTLEVRPFVRVNGRKSYHFAGTAISTSVFAMFYAVDDWFEAFVDYETLTPLNYALHVKESKQLRETRCLFDWKKKQAVFWDKKIDPENKVEERKFEWEIPPFSQNIFTAAYYLRNFQLRPGKKLAFVVAHEKENLMVTGEVLRREVLSTPIGDLNTVVIRPKIELNGVFKPVGEVLFWMTDDDRKFIVRIESKIKIGTVVASVSGIQPGRAPASTD